MSKFLDTYFDPSIAVDLSMTPEVRDAIELDRALADWSRASIAAAIPRRLADADRAQLALDKKRSRRLAHVAAQSIGLWGGKVPHEPDATLTREGAQVLWDQWYEERDAFLAARMTYAATWAKKTSNLKYGKQALQRFLSEREWYKYAMRD